MKVGNVRISPRGHFVLGVQFYKMFVTAAIVLVPALLQMLLIARSQRLLRFDRAQIAISVVTAVLAVALVFATGTVDPGILPGRELRRYYLDRLETLLARKQYQRHCAEDPLTRSRLFRECEATDSESAYHEPEQRDLDQIKAQFWGQLGYQVLDSEHNQDANQFVVRDKGHNISLKYCSTCGYFRPLRCVHGSKSSVCIQRYDHFCVWIGTDVGLHNYGLFLVMLALLCLHFGLQIATALVGLVAAALCLAGRRAGPALNWDAAPGTALSVVNLVLSALLAGANGFALKQTLELV